MLVGQSVTEDKTVSKLIVDDDCKHDQKRNAPFECLYIWDIFTQ